MKILSIRLKNLASLAGEQFIDFESEPLASAGLIAIVGKTGAGKSTILDAMCLALFNRVPRLKDSDGKLIDADGSELLSNSPLTILRRGSAHGFAELSFVAQDEKTYVARWEIKRARENPQGKLQSIQRSLKCLSDGQVIADKKSAVEQKIQQLTQLSFEQFTRAVLLAQSEVTAFLKARDHERGELLQYLTNSDIFEKVGQLAYEKTKQITNQRKALENVLGHIEILSEDELQQLQQQQQLCQTQYQQLEQEKVGLIQQQQWFEHYQTLAEQRQSRQQHLFSQQQQFDQLSTERQQLQHLTTASSILASVRQQKKITDEIHQLEPQQQHSQTQFQHAQQHFEQSKHAFNQVDQELKKQLDFEQNHHQQLEQIKTHVQARDFILQQFQQFKTQHAQLEQQQQPLLQQYQQCQHDLAQIEQQQKQQQQQLQPSQQWSCLDQSLNTHLTQLRRFIEHYQNFETQLGPVQQAVANLAQQQQQFDHFNQQFGSEDAILQQIEQQHQQREKNLHQIHQFSLIQNQLHQYIALQQDQSQRHSKQIEQQQLLKQQQDQLQQETQQYQTQKQQREQLQQLLAQQRLLHSDNIEKLRQQLRENEACIVCGSTQHPYRQPQSEFSATLFHLQQQQEQQALELEQQYFTQWQTTQQQLNQQQAIFNSNQQQFTDGVHHLQQLEQSLCSSITTLQLNADIQQAPESVAAKLSEQMAHLEQENCQIEILLKQLNHAQSQQRLLMQNMQNIQQQLVALQHAQQNLDDLIALFTPEQQQQWQTDTLAEAIRYAQQLQQRAQQLEKIQQLDQQHISQMQHLAQLEQKLQLAQQHIQSIAQQKMQCEHQGKEHRDLALKLIQTISHESVEKPQQWLTQFDQTRQQRQQQFNQSRQHYDQSRQAFEQQQRQLDQINVQLQQLQLQQHQYTDEIHVWLQQHTDFELKQLDQLSTISVQQQQHLRSTLQHAEHAQLNAQSALKVIEEQYQQHLIHQPHIDLAQILARLVQLTSRLEQLQEEKDQLKLRREVHQNNLEKQQQFAQQIQKIQNQEHRWNKISSLMGDATGKKFRDYAQQYHLDILIEYANQQLVMLSQRYTLKRLDQSLSLAIVDHDMDGETRSVASLSGGESFLTALALSLAIANMASGSMKIESLFIDEGFGTLDASSLHLVMNALDQLQSQGRKVVLISHITDMHERIPVQIQVNPVGAGASRIKIVG